MSAIMRLKKGVKIFGVKPEIVLAINIVNEIFERMDLMLTITSIRDGTHSRTSLHYAGYAFDIRCNDLKPSSLNLIIGMIRDSLTDEFDIVLEPDHIHIEFQPKSL